MCKRVAVLIWLVVGSTSALAQDQRPTVGVAFGGGSARGIAHVTAPENSAATITTF
jgi:hypothetical protein